MPITIENLSDKAREGKGKVDGSKIAHAEIAFKFDGVESSLNIDDWVNNKDSAAKLRAAINGEIITAGIAQKILNKWNCQGTIFADLLKAEFFAGGETGNFWAPAEGASQYFTGFGEHKVVAFEDATKELFMLLALGQAVTYWRENTSYKLTIPSLVLNLEGKASTVTLDWGKLMEKLREEIKTVANRADKAYASYNPDCHTKMDNIIITAIAQSAGGFRSLYDSGLIVAEAHGNGYGFGTSKKKFFGDSQLVSKGFEKQITAGLNHVRFILYLEWKVIHELIRKNA